MDFLSQYGMFVLKSLTLVIALLLAVGGVLSLGRSPKPKLTITSLNTDSEETQQLMHKEIFGKKLKKKKNQKDIKPNLYVIDFNGDIKASQVEQLREELLGG